MSRSRMQIAAALVLALALGTSVANAWTPIDSARPVWAGSAPYAMQSAGSADLGPDMTETLVRQGMDDWTRVSCTDLTTTYNGRTGTQASLSGGGDGQSIIGWLESGWPHESGAIGVTGPRWFRSIQEADMQMNGQHYTWITGSGSGSRVNAYSIILHEGGHYYGLGHSSDGRATMYYAYSGGIAALNADDQNGICALYPGTGTDCTTTGCPAGQACEAGVCVAMTGDGNVCSPCASGADCSGGVCLQYPDGAGYCGRNCTSSAECGSDQCVSITGVGGQCVRVAGGTPSCSATAGCSSDSQCSATQRCNTATRTCEARPTTGGPIGTACETGDQCQSGLCFAGACSQSCDWLAPTSCPGGFYCSGAATGSCGGSGVCLPGSAGGGALGDACSTATECGSLYCANGECAEPCSPGGAAGCSEGASCQVGAVPGCGSCQRSGQLGDPCDMNEDCTSGICAARVAGEGFCSQVCEGEGSCPTGFRCESAGEGVAVCAPESGTLGSPCADNSECLSGLCADEGDRTYCTRLCNGFAECPMNAGFTCTATDDPSVRVCRPAASNGCGCSAPGVPGTGSGASALLGLVGLLGLAAARRRRR